MEKKVGKVTVEILEGDISQQKGDALVNAANNQLWMGAGVAGALKRRGGVEIEREAVAKGPIPIGEAVVTSAGQLQATYVIHAAVMGADLTTDAQKIEMATRSSLTRATELGISSLVFPALGTGVGGFSLHDAGKIMLRVVKGYLETETSSLTKITFVLFGQEAYGAFQDALEEIFP